MKDNKARKETLWQTEINEHDEQETIHHHYLNHQTRKKTNELFISELKAMNFENQINDFMLFISVYLHVNWKLKWFNHIAQMLTLKFQIWNFKEILNEIIKIKDDDVKSWIITN